jgi:AcrR family transcriptional regulator
MPHEGEPNATEVAGPVPLAPPEGDSGVRRRPVQRRGLATMTSILDAGQELLAERGLEGFTTNAIAERAGINIATLYGYFADKQAILYEMSARYERQRADFLSQLAPQFAQAEDWRDVAVATIDHLARMRTEVPGSVELRTAIVAIPELRHLDHERDDRVTEYLAAALLTVRPDLDPAEARRAAAPVIIAGAHVLDRACEGGTIDEDLLAGFREMVLAHLERVLARPHPDGSRP